MKKIMILMLLTISLAANAMDKDTIRIQQSQITKLVADSGVSPKGKKYTKYYAIVNGELVSVSKSVVEKINLCKKYGAKCALAVVRNKNTHTLQRIILD